MSLTKKIERMIDSEINKEVNPILITQLKKRIEQSKIDIVNGRIDELMKTKEGRAEFQNNGKNDPRFDPKKMDYHIDSLTLDIYLCGLDYLSHALKDYYYDYYDNPNYPKPTVEDARFLSKLMAATEHAIGICGFARFVNGADIELLEEALIKTGDIYNLLEFAKKVKRLDYNQKIEYIIQNCSRDHIKKYVKKANSIWSYSGRKPGMMNFENMGQFCRRELEDLEAIAKTDCSQINR